MIEKINNPNVHYTWFDFHHECKKMKYENIGHLVDEIKGKIETHDYFVAQVDAGLNEKGRLNSNMGNILCYQGGVIRTNCVDCLDRTNAV